MIRIVVKTLKFRGEDTKISKIFLGENPAFTIKYPNLYDLKIIRIVVKTLRFQTKILGENPPSPKQPITIQYIS